MSELKTNRQNSNGLEKLVRVSNRIDRLLKISAVPTKKAILSINMELEKLPAHDKSGKLIPRSRLFGGFIEKSRNLILQSVGLKKRNTGSREASRSEDVKSLLMLRKKHHERLARINSAINSLSRALDAIDTKRTWAPGDVMDLIDTLQSRVDFLYTLKNEPSSPGSVTHERLVSLALETIELMESLSEPPAALARIGSASIPPYATDNRSAPWSYGRRSPKKSDDKQLMFDFIPREPKNDEPRIWLPVSSTRTRELVAMGARVDRSAPKRGSQLWIPLSEKSDFEQFLPLAYKENRTKFSFPPIRHNAIGQNLWGIFDSSSWNHIRTTAYDRSGHRCQICGKQGGSLWPRIADEEEKGRGQTVDCHEIWDWVLPQNGVNVGIQKLQRLMVLCKDCHLAFHEGFAINKAKKFGLEERAANHIRTIRMLINHCSSDELEAILEKDNSAWQQGRSVDSWILDLSHLAAQDFMADYTPTLIENNRANITPDSIGGIGFKTQDGTTHESISAADLIRNLEYQYQAPLGLAIGSR